MNEQQNRYASHINEIERVLDGKADREVIREKFMEYTEKFMIDIPSAKKAIVKNFGGDISKLGEPRLLMELTDNEPAVDIRIKVLSINPKTIMVDGNEKTIYYGLMGDSSGVLPFTSWQDIQVQKGDTVLVRNAYVKGEFGGRVQVNFGNRITIEKVPSEVIGEIPQQESRDLTIGDLGDRMSNINVKGKILNLRDRKVMVKDEERTVFSGVLGDSTGTIQFSAWDSFNFGAGETLDIRNAYTKSWSGRAQLAFNDRTEITRLSDTDSDVGIVLKEFKVNEFRDGLEYVTTKVRILEIEKRTVNSSGGSKTVFSGVCGDDSGTCSFSSWEDFELKENDVIRIEGAYIRQWRGPQLTLGENVKVIKLPGDELPPASIISEENLWTIGKLIESDGAINIRVDGAVLDIKKGSGLIWRCPVCRRVLTKGMCAIHKKVEGEPDLRIKAVLDDGTGALHLIIGRDLTENILGITLDKAIETMKQNINNPDVITDDVFDLLVAKPVTVKGNVSNDEFGVMMIANSFQISNMEPVSEAEEFLEALGV